MATVRPRDPTGLVLVSLLNHLLHEVRVRVVSRPQAPPRCTLRIKATSASISSSLSTSPQGGISRRPSVMASTRCSSGSVRECEVASGQQPRLQELTPTCSHHRPPGLRIDRTSSLGSRGRERAADGSGFCEPMTARGELAGQHQGQKHRRRSPYRTTEHYYVM